MPHDPNITSWALNELTPAERSALEAELKANPELQTQARQTQDFCRLMSDHLKDESVSLTRAQREKLTAAIMAPAQKTWWRKPALLMPLSAAAALVIGSLVFVNQQRIWPAKDHAAQSSPTLRGGSPSAPDHKAASTTDTQAAAPAPEHPMLAAAPVVTHLDADPRTIPVVLGPRLAPMRRSLVVLESGARSSSPVSSARETLSITSKRDDLTLTSSDDLTANGTITSTPGVLHETTPRRREIAPRQNEEARLAEITKIGSGTWQLSGTNTYTGGITINGGALQTTTITRSSGDGFASMTVTSTISGSGSMVKSGDAIIAFGASSSQAQNDPRRQVTFTSTNSTTAATTLEALSAASSPASSSPAPVGLGQLTRNESAVALNATVGTSAGFTSPPKLNAAENAISVTSTNTFSGVTVGAGTLLSPGKSPGEVSRFYGTRSSAGYRPQSKLREGMPVVVRALTQPADALADSADKSETLRYSAELPPVAAKAQPDGETYAAIVENALTEITHRDSALSTFSIDVDTASYANVRRFLNDNQRPPANAVRIEELVNYFPYDYELPDRADQPFAVQVDVAEAPWQPAHRLARIGIKAREMGDAPRKSNFVFLVDVSGSMKSPDKLALVKKSLDMLVDQLDAEDRVAIVTYAGASGLALASTSGKERDEIRSAISGLQAGGTTNGSGGIVLAYQQAQDHFIKDGVNRVILCTDGDFNVGVTSTAELEKLITEKAKGGVFLSVLGFGTGNTQDAIMETLADKGNGNYGYIDSLSEARKVLVDQMQSTLVTVAKDVKIQIEFNPAAVRAYRLIGYENRALTKEDFNNDAKDAGEIGAGHTVTALYEIVLVGTNALDGKPLVDALKYQAPTKIEPTDAAKSGELFTVKLRYKEPDGITSKLIEKAVTDKGAKLADSPRNFQFASAAAGYGLLLRDSAYKGTLTWDTVRQLALAGKGPDPFGYRGEFLQLIDKARSVTSGDTKQP